MVASSAVSGKWKLQGYDAFEGGPDAFYPIEGEHDSEDQAREAARACIADLEKTQPSSSSGGQPGIQDRIYIVSPDGRKKRFLG